ncbi:hypothetical protein KEM55_000204, partial [Ascosphaera atra]
PSDDFGNRAEMTFDCRGHCGHGAGADDDDDDVDSVQTQRDENELIEIEGEREAATLPEKEDLFRYGCLAKVVGVQGRPNTEPSLLVEGLKRFTVRKFVRDAPYFEAEVVIFEDQRRSSSLLRFIINKH